MGEQFTALGLLYIGLAMGCWASASIGYKYALGQKKESKTNPLLSIAIRGSWVFVVFLLLSMIISYPFHPLLFLLNKEYFMYALMAGLTGYLADVTYFNALQYIDSSRVYPLINTQMLFTYPLSYFLFKETIPSTLIFSAFLMIAGTFFLGKHDKMDKGHDSLTKEESRKANIKGIFLALSTGFFFAFTFIFMALQNRIVTDPISANANRMVFYSLFSWLGIIFHRNLYRRKRLPYPYDPLMVSLREERRAYFIISLFGILSAGFGDLIYQLAILELGTALSITLVSATPLLNQILAIVFLKEKFRKYFLIGALLIVGANLLLLV